MNIPWIMDRVEAPNAKEVVELLRSGDGPPWLPTGAGTRLGRGAPPPVPVRALCLRALDAVVEHAWEDLTVTVEAGVTAGRLGGLLRERGQWLPCLGGIENAATVGGIVAADRRGPWAGGWGSTRDTLLGVTLADGTGRVARGGGRVVKNVAGYDLMKLLTGSLGELGVLLEVTFKVLPRPPALGGVLLEDPDPRAAARAARDLPRGGLPAGLWRFDLGEGERLAAIFAGPRADVAMRTAGTRDAWGHAARVLDEDGVRSVLERFTAWTRLTDIPLGWGGALPEFLAERRPRDLWGGGTYFLDLLGGHLWCAGGTDAAGIARGREALRQGEGHLNLDHPPQTPPEVPVWGSEPGEEGALWRRVKDAFDPRGRLVWGRLPGGI